MDPRAEGVGWQDALARCIGKLHYGLCENGEFIWFISGKTRRMSQELVVWVCKYFMLHVA